MSNREIDEIDTNTPGGVQSLRSRFERMADAENELNQATSHSRAASNTTCSPAPKFRNGLKTSSSYSDLKDAVRHPPPPPPSRPAKAAPETPSSSSPLLRPVPPPPTFNGGQHSGTSSVSTSPGKEKPALSPMRGKSPVLLAHSEPNGTPRLTSWTSDSTLESHDFGPALMRNKFATAPSSSKSYSARYTSVNDILEPTILGPKPTVPPRPIKTAVSSGPSHQIGDAAVATVPNSFRNSTCSVLTDCIDSKPSFPPRPPPRPKKLLGEPQKPSIPSSSTPARLLTNMSPVPPPLPVRHTQPDETATPPLPLPIRPSFPSPVTPSQSDSLPINSERKGLAAGRLPPPTRTIGINEKLPPPRRPSSPSSEEDDVDEDDSRTQMAAVLPDSSRSSRRPPILNYRPGYPEPKIQVPVFTASVSVSGTTVVVGQNHTLKIYDLAVSDVPVMTVDPGKEMGLKELKITSMEVRPCRDDADKGYILWVGTKEGHLFELDTRTGTMSGLRQKAHVHPICHIFRWGPSMFTLDESGKGLVFMPESSDDVLSLVFTQPHVVRIGEKQDFMKVIGGKLWTASRQDQQVVAVPGVRAPVLRVYDVFGTNTVRNVAPMEHIGPVTCAAVVPSQPELVYVGHEGGNVSIWMLEAEDGHPRCLEVVKVSMSDVLCLEGVNDQLWAGGRNGMISAYEVKKQKPWVVTNSWLAHPGLPVLKLAVDPYGIDRVSQLCVASIGRDEQLRLWDGLLGVEWVEHELSKHEAAFSNRRNLTMLLVSWNCDSARPDSLSGEPANVNFLTDVLNSVDSPPDVISFGFQEVIDLESGRMAAKSVILGSKKKEDGGLSDKVTGAYKRWYDRLGQAVRLAMPMDVTYSVVHSESLVGLFSCVFVKHTERSSLRDASIATIKRGMGGRYGNKGGIVSRFVIEDSSICLVNCHLAAGQNATRRRNADIAGILEEKNVFLETEYPFAYVGGGDGSMILDHEIVFVSGDMNYRIDHRRDAIVSAIRSREIHTLLAHDQLLREIKFSAGCRLRDFCEGALTFAPTYKYDPRTEEYDSSEKHRAPAWCDRVLWRTHRAGQVQQLHYRRYEVNVSDHRPISAGFVVTVKTIRRDVREKVRVGIRESWREEQARLLGRSREFYVMQTLL